MGAVPSCCSELGVAAPTVTQEDNTITIDTVQPVEFSTVYIKDI